MPQLVNVKPGSVRTLTGKMGKRGTENYLWCGRCQRQGGKVVTPVHMPKVQEDGSEKMVEMLRVDVCTLMKDGDGYCCHPQCR